VETGNVILKTKRHLY